MGIIRLILKQIGWTLAGSALIGLFIASIITCIETQLTVPLWFDIIFFIAISIPMGKW